MDEPNVLPPVFWVTRDSLMGELSSRVEVWAVRPHREVAEDGDVLWFAPLDLIDGEELTSLGEWSLAACRIHIGTIPDTSLECLVVGRDRDIPVEVRTRVVH